MHADQGASSSPCHTWAPQRGERRGELGPHLLEGAVGANVGQREHGIQGGQGAALADLVACNGRTADGSGGTIRRAANPGNGMRSRVSDGKLHQERRRPLQRDPSERPEALAGNAVAPKAAMMRLQLLAHALSRKHRPVA